MSRNSMIPVLLLVLCFLKFSAQATLSQPALKIRNVDHQVSDKLLNKGYGAMGVFGLGEYLDHLLTSAPSEVTRSITAITVFCPTDEGFIKQGRLGPATTLLHYHVIPFKVDKKILDSSPVGTPFPTFLERGPPLVKTVIPYTGKSSMNNVTILDWEIYNDGKVIVHGVENFFDPDFPLLHPYVVKEDPCSECKKNLHDHDGEIPKPNRSSSSLMYQVLKSPITKGSLLVALVALAGLVARVSYHRYNKKTMDQDLPV